jgi:hypothetical protein
MKTRAEAKFPRCRRATTDREIYWQRWNARRTRILTYCEPCFFRNEHLGTKRFGQVFLTRRMANGRSPIRRPTKAAFKLIGLLKRMKTPGPEKTTLTGKENGRAKCGEFCS